MDARTIRAHATEQVLLDRIAELLRYRRWYRQHPYTVDWPSRQEHAAELRALVRLARSARATGWRTDFAGDHHVYPAGVGR